MPLSEKKLLKRDAKRNIGEKLLQAIRDVKAGRSCRVDAASTFTCRVRHPAYIESTSPVTVGNRVISFRTANKHEVRRHEKASKS